MSGLACKCGRPVFGTISVWPYRCPCGRVANAAADLDGDPGPMLEAAERAGRKAAICRSDLCGHYIKEGDRCGILVARGMPGRIAYLRQHSEVACVAEPPQFGRE